MTSLEENKKKIEMEIKLFKQELVTADYIERIREDTTCGKLKNQILNEDFDTYSLEDKLSELRQFLNVFTKKGCTYTNKDDVDVVIAGDELKHAGTKYNTLVKHLKNIKKLGESIPLLERITEIENKTSRHMQEVKNENESVNRKDSKKN